MALQKDFNFKGILIPNAYIKVGAVSIDNVTKKGYAAFSVYATKEATEPIARSVVFLPIADISGDAVEQAYISAKTTEFAEGTKEHNLFNGATDC